MYVINISGQVVNTFYGDIQNVQVTVVDATNVELYDFFHPIANNKHTLGLSNATPCFTVPPMESLGNTQPCLSHEVHHVPVSCLHMDQVIPAHHLAQQKFVELIHDEFQLFGKNKVYMVNSQRGVIPDI
ncbi:dual specificity protein phosphatase 18-like [Choloepus didactylus]|uniref:dual specificity protein phosphatase 18-like n=1 Tax=Choloepus didactylus TaxID=27675 RepID=UPI00189E5D68|nr:dual specificity protein phosphatase 18-like [Choloepus didactylus]